MCQGSSCENISTYVIIRIIHSSLGLSSHIALLAEVKCFAVVLLPNCESHRNVHSHTKLNGPACWLAFFFVSWQTMIQFLTLTPDTIASVFGGLSQFPQLYCWRLLGSGPRPLPSTHYIIVLIFNSLYFSVISAAATFCCELQAQSRASYYNEP